MPARRRCDPMAVDLQHPLEALAYVCVIVHHHHELAGYRFRHHWRPLGLYPVSRMTVRQSSCIFGRGWVMGTDYVITEPLRDEANVAIYHGQRVRDHLPVVIKLLGPRRRLPRDLERLRNEFEIASRLDTASVVEVLALETLLGAPALILRDFGGRALAERPSG